MNKQKAILYLSIMIISVFIINVLLYSAINSKAGSIFYAFIGTLLLNGPVFVFGLIAEGVKFNSDPNYTKKGKVFWQEWIETTFAIWIMLALIVIVLSLFRRVG